jgi:hypothetical protein
VEIGFADVAGSVADFYSRLALAGYCGQHLGRPLVIARRDDAANRISSARRKKLEGQSMGACCGGNAEAILAAKRAIAGMTTSSVPDGKVRLEYVGQNVGSVTYNINGKQIRGGRNEMDGVIDVDAKDAERMMQMQLWRAVSIGVHTQAMA